MGGASSTTSTTALNQAISNSVLQTIQSCQITGNTNQTIVFGANSNTTNSSFTQTASYTATCFQDATAMSGLISNVTNAISSSASASSPGLWGALSASSSNVNTTIQNIVQNNLSATTMNSIVTDINNNQTVIIGSGAKLTGVNVSQISSTLSNASNSIVADLTTAATGNNTSKSTSTATVTDPISDMISAIGSFIASMTFIYIAAFVILAIACIYFGPTMIAALGL